MVRILLYGVPGVTVLIVAVALLVGVAPREVVGARLLGGPSPDGVRVSVRMVVLAQRGDAIRSVAARPVRLELREPGGALLASWEGELDQTGEAAVDVDMSRPSAAPPTVVVRAPWARELLALGTLGASRDHWRRSARWRGGYIESRQRGELQLRVAVAGGVLAVPFPALVLVEVRRGGQPLPDVAVSPQPESLAVERPPGRTNHRGRTSLVVRPLAHIAALGLSAEAAGAKGSWYSTLPAVAGALDARLGEQQRLEIRSPIARELAFFSLVTERGRYAGGSVALVGDGHGGGVGFSRLPPPPRERLWAVVSSESDLASPATVGWPLGHFERQWMDGSLRRPPRSLTIPDQLLVDGLAPLVRAERERQAKVRRVTALFVVTAMALVVLVILLRIHESEQRLQAHLARTVGGAGRGIAPASFGRWLSAGVAVLCVMFGFLLLALLALVRV